MTLYRIPMVPARSLFTLAVLCCTSTAFAVPQAPTGEASKPNTPGCTLQGRNYICSRPDLERSLGSARTVAIVSQPANHASDAALTSLAVKSLNKVLWSPGSEAPADLTIRLTPIEPAGVSVGLNSVDLAMLNIFAPADGNPLGRLLWSETYSGSPDLPWPTVANAITRQLRNHLGLK